MENTLFIGIFFKFLNFSPNCEEHISSCENCRNFCKFEKDDFSCLVCGFINIMNVKLRKSLNLSTRAIDRSELIRIQRLVNEEAYIKKKEDELLFKEDKIETRNILRILKDSELRLKSRFEEKGRDWEFVLGLFTNMHFQILSTLLDKDDPIIPKLQVFFNNRDHLISVKKQFYMYQSIIGSSVSDPLKGMIVSGLEQSNHEWSNSSDSFLDLLYNLNQILKELYSKALESYQSLQHGLFSLVPFEISPCPNDSAFLDKVHLLRNAYRSISSLIH